MTGYLHGQTLWQRVKTTTELALAKRALQPIPTHCIERAVQYPGGTFNFQVRVVDSLARKARAQRARAAQISISTETNPKNFNPFQPYETDLYVGELTEHYRCLLNKFNVVNHHILMVTTEFHPQRTPLTREDFVVAILCLQAQDGMVFYNGGTDAGASVQHKHLQMIPLPLFPATSFPLADSFSQLPYVGGVAINPHLPFAHAIAPAAFSNERPEATAIAEKNFQRYQQLLRSLALTPHGDGLMPPHNMLLTRDFLWVVPRCRESYRGLAVNALGFTGAFLLKDKAQLQILDDIGCLELLKATGLTAS